MNIFLPYCHEDKITYDDIANSVKSLDDKRLVKQILEIKQIYNCYLYSINEIFTEHSKGYINHPVIQYYIKHPEFLSVYGECCCYEYYYRFNKHHIYEMFFLCNRCYWENYWETYHVLYKKPTIPFYVEKSKKDPTNIRTTKNVDKLFQIKLNKKWNADLIKGNKPKWTKEDIPAFRIE